MERDLNGKLEFTYSFNMTLIFYGILAAILIDGLCLGVIGGFITITLLLAAFCVTIYKLPETNLNNNQGYYYEWK